MDDFQNLSQEIYVIDVKQDSNEDIIIIDDDDSETNNYSLKIGMKVFALKDRKKCIWQPAIIKSIITPIEKYVKYEKCEFLVEFLNETENDDDDDLNMIDDYESYIEFDQTSRNKKFKINNLDTTCLALTLNPFKILPIKSRVVSFYNVCIQESNAKTSTKLLERKHLCSAVIAEKPNKKNLYRYLIFFDNGYISYVKKTDIFPIIDSLELPIDRLSRDHVYFIRDYFANYPKRSFVLLEPNQLVYVYFNKIWIELRVIEVDCLLVKFEFNKKACFPSLNQSSKLKLKSHNVWFYCGSFRLLPLFKKVVEKLEDSKIDNSIKLSEIEKFLNDKLNSKYVDESEEVLKMSSTHLPFKRSPSDNSLMEQQQGSIDSVSITNLTSIKYKPHECNSKCFNEIFTIKNNNNDNNNNPLLIPLLNNWQRQVCYSTKKKSIYYVAPCGRRLRTIDECYDYLNKTKSAKNSITIDMFTYDTLVDVSREFKSKFKILNDLTNNCEQVPIPVINYIDDKQPEKFNYISKRISLLKNEEDDKDDDTCCDCTDNCMNKLKCSCWQKTLKLNSFANNDDPLVQDTNIGYKYKRLKKPVHSGIFECNRKCKCNDRIQTCLNRVVQQEKNVIRLELYKTVDKGWAVRCIDDLPKGMFVSLYIGDLITEQESLTRLETYGDTYFTELNFISNLNRIRLNNSRLTPPQTDSDCSNNRKRKLNSTSDTKSDNSIIVLDNSLSEDKKVDENELNKSFDKNILNDTEIYVIDAKLNGNISRFINHSCAPNTFIQYVFTEESKSLKYPQIALFTLNSIKAGTELTWDYNYKVGSIKGRQLYCCCNSSNCRGRLI